MYDYKCIRAFASEVTGRAYWVGTEIRSNEYRRLPLHEMQNFEMIEDQSTIAGEDFDPGIATAAISLAIDRFTSSDSDSSTSNSDSSSGDSSFGGFGGGDSGGGGAGGDW